MIRRMVMMMLRTALLLSPNNLSLKLHFLGWAVSSTQNTKGKFSEWFIKVCFATFIENATRIKTESIISSILNSTI